MNNHIVLSSLRTSAGVLISAIAAWIFALLFAHTLFAAMLPFLFAAVLILLSWRFGAVVSVVGSVLAVFVFARLVYAPVGSAQVDSEVARSHLAWMVLLAVAGSYLLFPSKFREGK